MIMIETQQPALPKPVSRAAAKKLGDLMHVNWSVVDLDQFWKGLNIELEHGLLQPTTNITDDSPIETAKIALSHLRELPDYYDRLEQMEDTE